MSSAQDKVQLKNTWIMKKHFFVADETRLSGADLKLLKDQNEIYEDFLDSMVHLRLRSVLK